MTEPFALERDLLKLLNRSIAQSDDGASDFRDKREGVWKLLDDADVPRATIAEWSSIDAMAISRALGPKKKKAKA